MFQIRDPSAIEMVGNVALCKVGPNKALCLLPKGGDSIEIPELEVTFGTEPCRYTPKAVLRMGLNHGNDMCITEDLLIICGIKTGIENHGNDNTWQDYLAAVNLNDWQIKWNVKIDGADSVCPAVTQGTVFVVQYVRFPW